MKRTTLFSMAASVTVLLLGGCDRPAEEGAAAQSTMPGMPGMQRQAEQRGAEHMAEGTVNSIDRAAGTVNISHGPVASASWPAMTMSFKLADPSAAASVTPGQKVEFHFTIESGMSATVTQISPTD